MTPLLEVHNLTKHFSVQSGFFRRQSGAVRAVNDVSFAVAAGETLGVVGESGCGKSTLVKSLLFLDPPTSGEVRFRGEPATVADAPRLRRHIQMVFQDPYTSLPPRMRIGDAIADPLRIHGLGDAAAIEQRVRRLLREVGISPERAHHYPHQFSGGQRQRIGIARALAIEPSLLVLDEAVSALDVSVRAQMLNLLKDLQERHRLTYIFISHDLGVVEFMSDRIAVMYLGRIVEIGSARDVARHPLHPYTRALISAVPSLHGRRSRVHLHGEPPKPTDPPPGCAFHPRCPIAQPVCARQEPALEEWRPGHFAACHFALTGPDPGGSPQRDSVGKQPTVSQPSVAEQRRSQ